MRLPGPGLMSSPPSLPRHRKVVVLVTLRQQSAQELRPYGAVMGMSSDTLNAPLTSVT